MKEMTFILVLIIALELQYVLWRNWRPLPARKTATKPVFVDTSALMDGRIVTAAQTGFISGHLIVPRSVVAELQLLADGGDADKRSRARRGLDVINELQNIAFTKVEVLHDDEILGSGGVDSRLIELAKKHDGMICTIDFNLSKVAKVEGIAVLNINELAQSLRMAFLPGEKLSLELVQKGQEAKQAVGYLADGTMVVVEQAADSIGKTVEIEIIRSLQTAAGRMMFARKVKNGGTSRPVRTTKPKGTTPRTERKAKRPASAEESILRLVNDQDDVV